MVLLINTLIFALFHLTSTDSHQFRRSIHAQDVPKEDPLIPPPPQIPSISITTKPNNPQHIQATVVEVKPPNPMETKEIDKQNNSTLPQPPLIHTPNFKKNDLFESGAVLRAFYVLLGATFLLMLYLGFRMFRLRRGSKPPSMVMKYGVLARREDSEILPLPLSEDEDEDNTVFELSPINR